MIVNPELPHQAEAKRRANVEIRKWNVVVMIIGPPRIYPVRIISLPDVFTIIKARLPRH